MIEVQSELLPQVEYLISQSQQGNHILFDAELVRKAFTYDRLPLSEEDAYSVEPFVEKLLTLPTLTEKKAYLDQLDPVTLNKVVKTYFNIIENNLVENQVQKH